MPRNVLIFAGRITLAVSTLKTLAASLNFARSASGAKVFMKKKPNGFIENLGNIIGRSRYFVLIPVIAVMLVSLSLFLLGTIGAAKSIYSS